MKRQMFETYHKTSRCLQIVVFCLSFGADISRLLLPPEAPSSSWMFMLRLLLPGVSAAAGSLKLPVVLITIKPFKSNV